MKGFVCQVCGHVEFAAAPEFCPVCHAPRKSFTEDAKAAQVPADPKALTEGEKKHVPVIETGTDCDLLGGGCLDICIKVGAVPHVMEEKHFIGWIDVYLDDKFVARTHLTPPNLNAAICLHAKAGIKKVTVVEWCNVHGRWMAETR